jgi:predicted RNase H-like nuclease (RuvC/YqgF family)
MTILRERNIALGVILCVAICVIANAYPGKSSSELEGITGSQDVRSLDRRISSLEQRLYSIGVSINRLEQSAISQRTPVLQPGALDREINQLQSEIRTLQLRLSEIECGLAKLDERTTTPAVRDRRRSGERTADPCRINPTAPLRLSNRP